MGSLRKLFVVMCLAVFVFTACQSKKEEPKAGAAAAGKPAPEFLALTLACLNGGGAVEKMEIPIKSLLESLDRGDWQMVTLDAEAGKKYSLAWEYVMDQGGGKTLSYTFGQSKEDPKFAIVYASASVASGARTAIEASAFYAKIKAQAEQLKSFK